MFNKQVEFNNENKLGVTKFEEVNNGVNTFNSDFDKSLNTNSTPFYPVNFMGTGRMCEDWSI